MFATRAIADKAAEELRLHGYAEVHVFGGAAGASAESHTDALCKAYVEKAVARVLARGLAAGRGLVVVHTQFGRTAFAEKLLNRHGPVDDGLPDRREPGPRYEDAAPLSSALQLPVLTRTQHPFEAFSSLPTLTRSGWTFSDAMQFGVRATRAAPLSEALGIPTVLGGGCHPTALFGPLVLEGRSHKPRAADAA
jgi:hypothetical protein